MASVEGEQLFSTNNQTVERAARSESREGSLDRKVSKDRDEKLKLARERQNEERQRKIEELKAQAEAAQRYREQKEEERRRRMDEIRHRDTEKRQQVEERKRAIMEAEKERREYIMKKNQEREYRLEAKKKERSSIGFAFGSSTPRLLEPTDFGTVSPSTFWSNRRSTSISNVAGASLSRRSSERELVDSASKKRATSAGGTDRHDEEKLDASHIVFRSVARRKTDLMPTMPSPRDGQYGSRSSLSNTPKTPGRAYSMNRLDQLAQPIRRNGEHIHAIMERERRSHIDMLDETESIEGSRRSGAGDYFMSRSMTHLFSGRKYKLGGGISSSFRPLSGNKESCSRSGNVTPGGSINTSRPGSAMSTSTNLSTSGYVPKRSAVPMRKPRPASIAGTGVSLEEINRLKKENKPPVKSSSPLSAQVTPKRTSNMMSTSLIVTSSRLSSTEKNTSYKRDSSTPKQLTSKPLSKTPSVDLVKKPNKELKPKNLSAAMNRLSVSSNASEKTEVSVDKQPLQPASIKDEKNARNIVKIEEPIAEKSRTFVSEFQVLDKDSFSTLADEKIDQGNEKDLHVASSNENFDIKENSEAREVGQTDDMSASMIARNKITTEEEAKAALAERRRLAREEAERQAELERLRLEAERVAEIKKQEKEAERQRQFEEEAIRLAEEQRKAEEERLRQAIEEAKQREEEERVRREEEEKQRLEREVAEKKAKEEAEKQRLVVAERLKREEKEREERRKRVEAIMSRTRKIGASTTPLSTPVKEKNEILDKSVSYDQIQQPEQQQSSTAQNISGTIIESPSPIPATTTPKPSTSVTASGDPKFSQAVYEQSVADKEISLMQKFCIVNEENLKNFLQQKTTHQQLQPSPQNNEIANGLKLSGFKDNESVLLNTNSTNLSVANGNGHIENINKKNGINIVEDVVAGTTNQLVDLSIESQDVNNSVKLNKNTLLTTTKTLVTENEDISLL